VSGPVADPEERAMKYVCLVYTDPAVFAKLSPQEMNELDEASLADDEELERSGHLILAQALQSPDTATTVRVRDGRMSVTDGPYAETTEYLGGFVYLEARDLNEAISLAGRFPIARYASIEVRPVLDVAQQLRDRQEQGRHAT
jgi:hypothetical protein